LAVFLELSSLIRRIRGLCRSERLQSVTGSITQTLDGYQIRRQETECVEASEPAFAPEPSTRCEAKSLMNTQALPGDFLQKFFPELARAKPISVDSPTTEGVSIQTDGVSLSTTPRFINEPGIVEIILRVRVDGPTLVSSTRTAAIFSRSRRRPPRPPKRRRRGSRSESSAGPQWAGSPLLGEGTTSAGPLWESRSITSQEAARRVPRRAASRASARGRSPMTDDRDRLGGPLGALRNFTIN
jgi:hypothetical protein